MKRLALISALLLAACAPSADAVATAIAQTQAAATATQEAMPTDTPPPSPTARPTNTPLPSPTPRPPTPTPTPTQAPSVDELWAINYLGGQDSGGVVIEVVRLLVGYKQHTNIDWAEVERFNEDFRGTDVVGEIIVKVTNNSDRTAKVYPLIDGTIQLGTEFIELFGVSYYGPDPDGDIPPGAVKYGVIWFPIRFNTPDTITQAIYRVGHPVDENYNRMGPDYEIVMDVSEHRWEDLPDEIKRLGP